MSKTICKYKLDPDKEFYILPQRSKILSAGVQGQAIYIWALVNPERPEGVAQIRVVGTGHNVDVGGLTFIDTVFLGWMVWHIFGDMIE